MGVGCVEVDVSIESVVFVFLKETLGKRVNVCVVVWRRVIGKVWCGSFFWYCWFWGGGGRKIAFWAISADPICPDPICLSLKT